MEKQNSDKCITRTAILLRPGWTRGLVDKLLGEPDFRKEVRGYSNPLCLYYEKRVKRAEKSVNFSKAQKDIAKRKASCQKSIDTKTKNLLRQVDEMSVEIKKIDECKILDMAINSYNQWHQERMDCEFATKQSDKDFLDRIAVNFIRHNLTKYDRHLWELIGKTGKYLAYDAIRSEPPPPKGRGF